MSSNEAGEKTTVHCFPDHTPLTEIIKCVWPNRDEVTATAAQRIQEAQDGVTEAARHARDDFPETFPKTLPTPGAHTDYAGHKAHTGHEATEATEATLAENSEQLLCLLANLTGQVGFNEITLMSDDDLITLTAQCEQASRRMQSLLVTLSGAVEDRSASGMPDSLAAKRGCRSATELLQRLSQMPASTINRRLTLARATRSNVGFTGSRIEPRYPMVAAALTAGDLPEETALHIVRTLSALPPHVSSDAIGEAEACIVAQAAGYPSTDDSQPDDDGHLKTSLPIDCDTIKQVCRMWCEALDQDGIAPSEEVTMAGRYLRFGQERHGLVPLRGNLLPEAAALLGTLFDAINSPRTTTNSEAPTRSHTASAGEDGPEVHPEDQREDRPGHNQEDAPEGHQQEQSKHRGVRFEATGDDASDTTGDDTSNDLGVEDSRTFAQKQHDAFMIIAQVAARAKDTPLLGGAPVTVLVQVTEDELATSLETPGRRGRAWLHGHDGLPTPTNVNAARHGICSGATQRIVTGPNGEIRGLESPTRIFTAVQRRAITARDGGCIIPGCSVPATWCEVHHVTEYQDGGPTSTDNGVLLCWYHHRNLDANGWRVRMVDALPQILAPPWIDPASQWRPAAPPLRAPRRRRRQPA
ncbi:hypothetical protein JOF28_002785 [Leucobacter exalbidus]|uniref:HNH nuclease domain-containing protein n=1 Tax=Leucobacter exalbidus TaxID=662960 RepID=A0A940PVE8_9MICO|nr:HNH endonuclease signature motif containing protein [Leucobacter exalbidus]MBP1327553.1 hypothetical protein [Leucobacter exalbidus]